MSRNITDTKPLNVLNWSHLLFKTVCPSITLSCALNSYSGLLHFFVPGDYFWI